MFKDSIGYYIYMVSLWGRRCIITAGKIKRNISCIHQSAVGDKIDLKILPAILNTYYSYYIPVYAFGRNTPVLEHTITTNLTHVCSFKRG